MTYTDSSFTAYGWATYRYAVKPESDGSVSVIDKKNAVLLEPAWENILYDGPNNYHVEVAGTSTGEAFILASTGNRNKIIAYNNASELQYEVTLTSGMDNYVKALGWHLLQMETWWHW